MPAANVRRVDPWLLVALACAAGFLLLAAALNGQGSFAFDAPVTALVQALPLPTDVWLAITQAGGWVLFPVSVGLLLYLLAARAYRTAVIVAVALLAATFLTDDLKELIERPRPPASLVPVETYSFPSGHSLMSATTYGLVALVFWRSAPATRVRRAVAASLVGLVVLVGLSRIALGAHYPSDVLAGWLVGVAIVSLVAAICSPAPEASEAPAPREAPAAAAEAPAAADDGPGPDLSPGSGTAPTT